MKKFLTILTIIVLLNALGFGCKGLTQEQRAAIRPVVLNYWTVYNDVGELQKFADSYKQLRPYVTVNIRQVRYDEFDRLFTNALADDVAPDVVSMHTSWLRKYTGRLAPMPPKVQMARLIQKSKYSDDREVLIDTVTMPSRKNIKDLYVNTVYEDVVIGEQIYGLPLAVDALAIYYNRDLLDRSGVPEVPKNWDEFVEAVKKSTKFDATGTIVQSGAALGTSNNISAFFDIVSLFMLQSGSSVATGNAITFAGGIENSDRSHPIFKALDFYTNFARATKEVYAWNEKKPDAMDEFVRGRVAFYFGYAYDYPRIKARAPQLKMEIIPILQLNPASPQNVSNYWVESVVGKSKHQNEAWDFVRFITSAQNVQTYTTATFRPSPLRAQIAVQQQDEKMEPFATQALYARTWYHGKNIDVAREAFSTMINEYIKEFNGDANDLLKRDRGIIINAAARVQQTM